MNPPASDGREAAPSPSAEEYRAQVTALARAIATVHVLLADLDLARLSELVEHADAVGPLLHPTEWRAASARGQFEAQRLLLAWAAESRRVYVELVRLVPRLLSAPGGRPPATDWHPLAGQTHEAPGFVTISLEEVLEITDKGMAAALERHPPSRDVFRQVVRRELAGVLGRFGIKVTP